MQSGCALNPWVNGVMDTGKLLGDYFCRETSDGAEILEFLLKLDVRRILLAQWEIMNVCVKQITLSKINLHYFPMQPFQIDVNWICSPVIEQFNDESTFLRKKPIDIITSGYYNRVPIMIGYNNLEGMHWDIYDLMCKGHSEFLTDFSTVIPNNVHCTKGSLYCKTLEDKIKSTYFGYTKDDPCVWDKMGLFNLYTDVFWLRGIYSTIRNHLATSACPVYFYRFSVDSELNISKCLSAPFKTNCSYRGIVP